MLFSGISESFLSPGTAQGRVGTRLCLDVSLTFILIQKRWVLSQFKAKLV